MKKTLLLLLFSLNCLGQFRSDSLFSKSAPLALQKLQGLLASAENKKFNDLFFATFQKDFDDSLQYAAIKETHMDKFEMDLYMARKNQKDFLLKNESYKTLKDDYKTYLLKEIEFNYWYNLLNHAVLRSNLNTKLLKLISLPEVVTEAFDQKKMKEDWTYISSFRKLLPVYITYYNSKARNFEKYTDLNRSAIDKFSFAEKSLSTEAFQYYLASFLNENCGVIAPSMLKLMISNLESPSKEIVIKNCFEALAKKEIDPLDHIKNPKDEWALLGIDGKPLPLAKFKGKYVYVDFWASWCGPCRREFPFSKEMNTKLTKEQKKKIEFLFISIDDTQEVWKSAYEKLGLEGSQAWVEGAWRAPILGKMGVNSIPRYMILDPNGKVIDKDATRPSDPNTLNKLLQLIK